MVGAAKGSAEYKEIFEKLKAIEATYGDNGDDEDDDDDDEGSSSEE